MEILPNTVGNKCHCISLQPHSALVIPRGCSRMGTFHTHTVNVLCFYCVPGIELSPRHTNILRVNLWVQHDGTYMPITLWDGGKRISSSRPVLATWDPFLKISKVTNVHFQGAKWSRSNITLALKWWCSYRTENFSSFFPFENIRQPGIIAHTHNPQTGQAGAEGWPWVLG